MCTKAHKQTSYLLIFSLFLSVFLYGCGTKNVEHTKSSVVQFPASTDYTHLFIQGVDESGATMESESISDHAKIEAFIRVIDQIEVVTPTREEIERKTKELTQQGNYIIALSDSEDLENNVYSMVFFQDGSMYFPSSESTDLTYRAKDKNPTILKELLEITE